MSATPLLSPATRFVASEWKATSRPLRLSPEIVAPPDGPLAPWPLGPTEIGTGVGAERERRRGDGEKGEAAERGGTENHCDTLIEPRGASPPFRTGSRTLTQLC